MSFSLRGFVAALTAAWLMSFACAAEPALESPPSAPTPSDEPAAFDPLAVPRANELQPLLEYIQHTQQWQPQATPEMRRDQEAMDKLKAEYVASRQALLTAIDRALALKPEEHDRVNLLRAKLDALRMLSMLASDEKSEKAAEQRYEALTASLLTDSDPDLARDARKTMLTVRLNRFTEDRSAEPLEKLVGDITAAVENDETRAEGMLIAGNAALIIEMKGQYEAAKSLYTTMSKYADKLPDSKLQQQTATRAAGGLARLSLIGQVPDLRGVQLDGKPFDIAQLQGKVVLIDFWATWCEPCRAELPNVIKNYEQYHKLGFEVVGVSIDDDRAAVESFLKEQPLPWTTLFNPDEATRGFEDPNARKFHVDGIPATYLVDPSGKIVHVNIRGERLGKLLKGYYPQG